MSGRVLQRSNSDRVVAGVCAGIADYFGWSHDKTRIGYVVLSVLSAAFPGIGVYLALWFLMPVAAESSAQP